VTPEVGDLRPLTHQASHHCGAPLGSNSHQGQKMRNAAVEIVRGLIVTREGQPTPWTSSPPFEAELRFRQAAALHQNGRLTEAEALYRSALRVDPKHFDALHLLGVLCLQTGRTQQGVDLVAEAIAINRKAPAAAHSNLANGLKDLERYEKALASYDRAIALDPVYAEAYSNRADVLRQMRRFDKALASCDRALALKRDCADAYCNRGAVLNDMGRLEEAVASYDRCLALNPASVEAHRNRGVALYRLRRFEEAAASYDRALALAPTYARAHSDRAIALYERIGYDSLRVFDAFVWEG